MTEEDGTWSLRPLEASGSKRLSPTCLEEDREPKKPRTQPCDENFQYGTSEPSHATQLWSDFNSPQVPKSYAFNGASQYAPAYGTAHALPRATEHLFTGANDFACNFGELIPMPNDGVIENVEFLPKEAPPIFEEWPQCRLQRGDTFDATPQVAQNTPIADYDVARASVDQPGADVPMHDIVTHSTTLLGPVAPAREHYRPVNEWVAQKGSFEDQSSANTVQPILDNGVIENFQDGYEEIQTEDAVFEVSATPSMEKTLDVCCDFDTCYGVLIASPSSTFRPSSGTSSIPVDLEVFGDFLILQEQISKLHAGIISNRKLAKALFQHPLKLDATLQVHTTDTNGKRESKPAKSKRNTTVTQTTEYKIRIVIHGLAVDQEMIGDLLADAGFYLQHPYAEEVISDSRYSNPHYLLRPGVDMPRLERQPQQEIKGDDQHTDRDVDVQRGRLLRMFDNAGADGGHVGTFSISPSPRLRTLLKRHQNIALAMMLEKESGNIDNPLFPSFWTQNTRTGLYRHTITNCCYTKPKPVRGGIIADDMGLGKTLSTLALICSSLDATPRTDHCPTTGDFHGTLIVARKSIIENWRKQVLQHVHPGQLRVHIYHGPGRQSLASQFPNADIVITTYETLARDWAAPAEARPLYSWKWLRIVLDEAHNIRNRSSRNFQSACDLVSQHRWCLTGTPVHNSLDDYGALLSFIRAYPFEQKHNFTSHITKPLAEKKEIGRDRLQALVRATCLRRTKRNTQGTLQLPPRSDRVETVHLLPQDQASYDRVKKFSAERAAGLNNEPERSAASRGRPPKVLALINALRLICDHGSQLLSDTVRRNMGKDSKTDLDLYDQVCTACGGEIDRASCKTKVWNPLCANCAVSEEALEAISLEGGDLHRDLVHNSPSPHGKLPPSTSATYRPSAKVIALLKNLRDEREKTGHGPRKSFWVKMLDLVETALRQEHICFQRIDGSASLEGRSQALRMFADDGRCEVMLASIGSAAEGVDLTCAGIVHLMEPQWNPMVEAQAIDRVHRMGQAQDVSVIRYIVPDSIETHVTKVQERKRGLIDEVLCVEGSETTKLDLEESRADFNLETSLIAFLRNEEG